MPATWRQSSPAAARHEAAGPGAGHLGASVPCLVGGAGFRSLRPWRLERDPDAAAYQVNPSFLHNDEGLDLGNPSGTTGAHAVGELTWTPRLDERPGIYRLGLWRNTGDFQNLSGSEAPLKHASGYYLMTQQSLRRRPSLGRELEALGHTVKLIPPAYVKPFVKRQKQRGRCRGHLRGGPAANDALPAGEESRAAG